MSLRWVNHSSRGVLPTMVRRCVWSRSLVNEEALAHSRLFRKKKKLCFRSMTGKGDRYCPPKRSVVLIILNSIHQTMEKLHVLAWDSWQINMDCTEGGWRLSHCTYCTRMKITTLTLRMRIRSLISNPALGRKHKVLSLSDYHFPLIVFCLVFSF
jgi:hypothetical protein